MNLKDTITKVQQHITLDKQDDDNLVTMHNILQLKDDEITLVNMLATNISLPLPTKRECLFMIYSYYSLLADEVSKGKTIQESSTNKLNQVFELLEKDANAEDLRKLQYIQIRLGIF